MPATATTNPTKAALEAAVMNLTDEEILRALLKADRAKDVKRTFEERAAYAWPREAQRNLFEALARRLERGRVPS